MNQQIIEKRKELIDGMKYEQLLYHWRFAPAGDGFFIGEVGRYFEKRMSELRDELGEEAIKISKKIGWKKRGK
jgi:hypothetical protein